MPRKKLKMFVWEGVLVDWTPGMIVAFAKDVEHARQLVIEACSYVPPGDIADEPEVVTEPKAFLCWGGG